MAADQGNASAQFNLALMNEGGQSVAKEDTPPIKSLLLIAEQGIAEAQYNLGQIYRLGLGVPKDYTEALKWYSLAAKQGFAQAQLNLGNKYYFGVGVLQNNIKAHMWYNIASANGSDNSIQLKRRLVEKMTNSSIAEAQSMASKCMKSGYQDCGW